MTIITEPGFYPDITPDQYFAEPCPAPALTNSGIKTLLGSCPAKFAHEHPAIGLPAEEKADTVARHMGKLVHRLALDKGDDYEISPFDEYRSKEAKEWKAEVEGRGVIPVKRSVFDDAQAMAATIREGIRLETRDEPYQTEVVIAWQRHVNGLPLWCRAMVDVWCPSLNLALDVKSCVDAGNLSIDRAMAGGYARQHAWYSEGLEALSPSKDRPRFGFLFSEKEAPWLARYAEPTEAFRYGASMEIDKAVMIFAGCLRAGEWPGYRPYTAQPPAWWLNQLTDLELEEAA